MLLKQLQEFRYQLYQHLGTARDAVFDLMDGILVSPSITSFASLSQTRCFDEAGRVRMQPCKINVRNGAN